MICHVLTGSLTQPINNQYSLQFPDSRVSEHRANWIYAVSTHLPDTEIAPV